MTTADAIQAAHIDNVKASAALLETLRGTAGILKVLSFEL